MISVQNRNLSKVLTLVLAIYFAGACSGSQQQEDEDIETTQMDNETEQEEMTAQEEGAAELPDETEVEEVVEEVIENPAKAPATVDPARVVRFVRENNVGVFSEPTEGAPISMLNKGDTVVVREEGDWAVLSDGLYVKTESLSSEAVARERPAAVWRKPTH